MFYFDLNGLIAHLARHCTTARDGLSYLIGFVWLTVGFKVWEMVIGASPAETAASNPLSAKLIGGLLGGAIGAAISIAILKSYYRRNGGDSGQDFLGRLLALIWVVGLRSSVVMLPVFTVLILMLNQQAASGQSGLWLALISFVGAFAAMMYIVMSIQYAFTAIRSAESSMIGAELPLQPQP